MEIRRSNLFSKLGAIPFQTMESAVNLCKFRGNPYVELVHWTNQLLQQPDSDWHRILPQAGINLSRLAADHTNFLDRLPRGATAISDFAPQLEEMVERGWVYASLLFNQYKIRSGHLLVALLKTPTLRSALFQISREFEKLRPDTVTAEFDALTSGSPEAKEATPAVTSLAADSGASELGISAGGGKALAKFATNLTAKAKAGELDPVLGRDEEIRQIIDILMRRRQNNPILTGEAGVGKTAIVEGFALKIAAGEVPPPLLSVQLWNLDLGLLQAGAGVRGEFENRLKQVIEDVQNSPEPIILFIDEAHTLIGAGGQAGQGDAANLLKPALARGTLRTIAATTWAEYKKYFEKDPALTRRFQVIKVEEPSEETCAIMIRGLVPVLEKHHNVRLLDEALVSAVKLSHRYIPSRQLPDKAVSLLDTACARVAISLTGKPPIIEDTERLLMARCTERDILQREIKAGIDHKAQLDALEKEIEELSSKLASLQKRYQQEKSLVERIAELRKRLETEVNKNCTLSTEDVQSSHHPHVPNTQENLAVSNLTDSKVLLESVEDSQTDLLCQLRTLEEELQKLQGDQPLIHPQVDAESVAAVVADWTGIPVGRMVRNEIQAVLNLADILEKRVLGQRYALEVIAKRIQTSRAGFGVPSKPVGVFLLVGPSGVGKTETALALAEALFGSEQNLITINMSEFQESHTVSTLKGAPPGYVGYGEGGVLTEAVRRHPYSVVLLDEVEKAHRDVHEIFFQVFDKGWMEDGEGRFIDFKNTIILLTTNVGSELVIKLCEDPELAPSPEKLADSLRPELLKVFPAALLGRLVTVPYYPLSQDTLKALIHLQLSKVQKRLRESQAITLTYDESVLNLIATRCTQIESGGRMVDAIITQSLLPEISRQFLCRLLDGEPIKAIRLSVADNDFHFHFE